MGGMVQTSRIWGFWKIRCLNVSFRWVRLKSSQISTISYPPHVPKPPGAARLSGRGIGRGAVEEGGLEPRPVRGGWSGDDTGFEEAMEGDFPG